MSSQLTDIGLEPISEIALAEPPAQPPRRRRRRTAAIVTGVAAYLVTFLIVLPILWIVLLSFQPSGNILSNPFSFDQLTLDNYVRAITTLPLLQMYGNTILIAIVSVTVGTAISFMAAFALTRMIFRRPATQS